MVRIMLSQREFPSLLALVASVCLVVGATAALEWSPVFAMASRPPVVGTPAPSFELPNLHGETVALEDLRGKVVLLNFWATWCKPCVTEMPAMQRAYEALRDQGFVVLAINELEDEDRVRQHIAEHGHTFPVLLDRSNRVANMYGVKGLPVSVFVDESGRVHRYVKGGLLTEETIRRTVQRILAGSPEGASAAPSS